MNNGTFNGFKRLDKKLAKIHNFYEDSILHCTAYYILTGRRGCQIFENKETKIIVCYHPNIENTILVFPEIGKPNKNFLLNVIEELFYSKYSIQLARFPQTSLNELFDTFNGSKNSIIETISHINENILDWRFPVYLFDTKKITEKKGAEFVPLRRKLTFIEKRYNIEFKPLNIDQNYNTLLYILKIWEASMIINNKSSIEISTYYHILFDIIQRYPSFFKGLIFYHDDKPVGFTIWSLSHNNHAIAIANLADISIKNLSVYMRYVLCKKIYQEGIRYYNMGGSETAGLDQHKRQNFAPIQSIQEYSANITYIHKSNRRPFKTDTIIAPMSYSETKNPLVF